LEYVLQADSTGLLDVIDRIEKKRISGLAQTFFTTDIQELDD